jgi:nucleobase:cation symporter-1, NCS1 family
VRARPTRERDRIPEEERSMSTTESLPESSRVAAIETHSIDFIPLAERHGKPWNLFTLWFGANTLMISVITGAFLVAKGFGFGWAVLAIVIGFGLGTFLVAFHGAQGPRLGIPQMIQSRAQFGYVGGVVPMIVAEVAYIGFFAANPAVAGLVANAVWGVNVYLVVVLVTIVTFGVALFGYNLSHQLGKYLSVGAVIGFGIFTILLIAHVGIPHPTTADLHGGFNEGLFLGGVALCFVYAAGYAPYVADYSRYMPANSSVKATAWWSYAAIVLSGIWLFILGAYLTSITGFSLNTLGSVVAVTNSFSPVFTDVFAVLMLLILVLQGSLSLYAGGNTSISIVTSLQRRPRPVKPRVSVRLAALTPISVICLVAAILYARSFATAFTDMLSVLLILLVPWSAINLADFYFVRKGRYAISDIFNPHGIYGSYNIAGLLSFFLGFGLEWLFVSLSFYQSPVAHALDGGDISWVVGIVVSGGCYLLMTRGLRRSLQQDDTVVPSRAEAAS